jgi:hypothetical protein
MPIKMDYKLLTLIQKLKILKAWLWLLFYILQKVYLQIEVFIFQKPITILDLRTLNHMAVV